MQKHITTNERAAIADRLRAAANDRTALYVVWATGRGDRHAEVRIADVDHDTVTMRTSGGSLYTVPLESITDADYMRCYVGGCTENAEWPVVAQPDDPYAHRYCAAHGAAVERRRYVDEFRTALASLWAVSSRPLDDLAACVGATLDNLAIGVLAADVAWYAEAVRSGDYVGR